jgi:hypothetical protein
LRDEEIDNMIKINTPRHLGIKLAKKANCIFKSYEKYFPFYDSGNYFEYGQKVGYMHLEIESRGVSKAKMKKKMHRDGSPAWKKCQKYWIES